jgi:hypothetical protein
MPKPAIARYRPAIIALVAAIAVGATFWVLTGNRIPGTPIVGSGAVAIIACIGIFFMTRSDPRSALTIPSLILAGGFSLGLIGRLIDSEPVTLITGIGAIIAFSIAIAVLAVPFIKKYTRNTSI